MDENQKFQINIFRFCETHAHLSETPCLSPDSYIDFLKTISAKINYLEYLPDINLSEIPDYKQDLQQQIDVYIVSVRDAEEIFNTDSETLGAFINTNPDCDPFQDETAYAKKLRIIIPYNNDKFREHFQENVEEAENIHFFFEQEIREAATLFHEIAHILLFWKNAQKLSPHSIDMAWSEGKTDNEISDYCTCFNIRPLRIKGKEETAETESQAIDLMEEWCEEMALIWTSKIMEPGSYYKALGIKYAHEIERLN